MTKYFPLLALLAVLLVSSQARAQKHYNIWYFGDKAGIDFNQTPPAPLTDGDLNTVEGCASIADRITGRVLFYSDGKSVWNRNHQTMPNGGFTLLGEPDATQSALIVPVPHDTTRYYLFTADDYQDVEQGVNYSIIDMKLDNGLGDVDVATRNTVVLDPATEKLVGIPHRNGCDMWVITHGVGEDLFYVLRVGSAPPFTTTKIKSGSIHYTGTGKVGYLKASSDGKRLVAVMNGEYTAPPQNIVIRNARVDLFDFDNLNGGITFVASLPIDEFEYGATFSPDNSRLYISRSSVTGGGIYQYDLSSGAPAQIIASRTIISTEPSLGALQIAPDGKIYVARDGSKVMGVINNPNGAGAACNYNPNGFTLTGPSNITSRLGLPNNIDGYDPTLCIGPVADFTVDDSVICAGGCIRIIDRSQNTTDWDWRFQGGTPAASKNRDPGPVCFADVGWHTITLTVSNANGTEVYSDSIYVNPLPVADAGNDTAICLGSGAQLGASGGLWFSWSPTTGLSNPGIYNPVATPTVTTRYYVTVTSLDSCQAIDSVTVTVTQITPPVITPRDTIVRCAGDRVTLRATKGYATYRWPGNETTDSIVVATAGDYWVDVTDASGCQARSNIVTVIVNQTINATITPSGPLSFCEGDSVSLSAPTGFATYRWDRSPADTLQTIVVKSSGSYGVTIATSSGCTVTSTPVTVTVKPAPHPKLTASGPISLCDGDSVTLDAGAGDSYLWSNGATMQRLVVRQSGDYSVLVSNANGCSNRSDTIAVAIGEPSDATVTLPSLAAAPGDRVTIPLRITNSNNLDRSCAENFTATIRFNRTLLKPIGTTPVGTIDKGDRVITLTGSKAGATPSGTLATLEFVATLGNAVSTPLQIEKFEWDRGGVVLTIADGELRLKDICLEGDARLVNVGGSTGLKAIKPNPASGVVEIEYSVIESGPTQLTISDLLGRPVATLVDTTLKPGSYTVQFDASSLPSALYICTLQTPTERVQGRMVVVR